MKKAYPFVFILFLLLTVIYLFKTEILFQYQIFQLKRLDCYQVNNSPCKSKIWAHRVNSLERLRLLNGYFTGVEADIVFNDEKKTFLVYHPPYNNQTLRLESLIKRLRQQNQKVWLDMRGVDSTNFKTAYQLLQMINLKPGYDQNIIFELYDLVAANYFADKGLITAINVPVSLLQQYDTWTAFSNAVSKNVKFVSQEDFHIPLMKQYFPDKKIITWSPSFYNYFNTDHLQQLLMDEKIEIILVNVKSKYRS